MLENHLKNYWKLSDFKNICKFWLNFVQILRIINKIFKKINLRNF